MKRNTGKLLLTRHFQFIDPLFSGSTLIQDSDNCTFVKQSTEGIVATPEESHNHQHNSQKMELGHCLQSASNTENPSKVLRLLVHPIPTIIKRPFNLRVGVKTPPEIQYKTKFTPGNLPEMHSKTKFTPVRVFKKIPLGQIVGNITDARHLGQSPSLLSSLGSVNSGSSLKTQEKINNTSFVEQGHVVSTAHAGLGGKSVVPKLASQACTNETENTVQKFHKPQIHLIRKFVLPKKPQINRVPQHELDKSLLISQTEPTMKRSGRAQIPGTVLSGEKLMKLFQYQTIASTNKKVMNTSPSKSQISLQPQESEPNSSHGEKLKSKSQNHLKICNTSEMIQLKHKLKTFKEQNSDGGSINQPKHEISVQIPDIAPQYPQVSKATQLSPLSKQKMRSSICSDLDKYSSCPLCPKLFLDNVGVQNHIRRFHIVQDRYECDLCDKVYKIRQQLNVHRKTHNPERPFKCKTCNKAYKLRGHLNEHTKAKHTGEKRHFCDTCDFGTRNKPYLLYHKNRIHNLGLDYMCEHCGKKYPALHELKRHLDTHKDKAFKCELCNKSFHTIAKLIFHKNIHNPNRAKFKCTLCGVLYAHKHSLVMHIRQHSGITRHTCEFCGKNVSSYGTLRTHRRTHTGEKPFSCNVCYKRFTSKQYLVTHKRIHTGEKPFQCPECGTAFSQRGTLTIHLRLHRGVKPYQCKVCPKAFVTKTLLTYHIKSAHSVEIP